MKIRIVKPDAVPTIKWGSDDSMYGAYYGDCCYQQSDTTEIGIDELANKIGQRLSGLPDEFINPLEPVIKMTIKKYLQEKLK